MPNRFTDALVDLHRDHPMLPDVVLTAGARGEWTVRAIAPWFAAWSGEADSDLIGGSFRAAAGNAYDALRPVVEAVFKTGASVRDYCIEFADHRGQQRGILVLAERARLDENATGDDDAAVFLRFHDVSDTLRLQRTPADTNAFEGIIARSKAMAAVFRKIELYGPVDMPVVITGETGTGKELTSRAIHEQSTRASGPFIAFNCTAVSTELLDSELFGHEKGAFTGAVGAHRGLFEQADGGTLFLDEVGEMSLATQTRLLRVLEDGKVSRVGGEKARPVDVRIVAATNVPLELAVGLKRFRADLYHRLSVLRIHLPPLRERREDIPLLIDHFLGELSERYEKPVLRLTREALEVVVGYAWPGNVRELRNALHRVFVESSGPVIGREAFDEWMRERQALAPSKWKLDAAREFAGIQAQPDPLMLPPPDATELALTEAKPADADSDASKPKELTEDAIRDAFAKTDGNATKAARLLGVHKATLYRRLKSLGIDRDAL